MTKELKFYKSPKDNNWYLYVKYFPKFLKPLLQMILSSDRLLDILWMESKSIVEESQVEAYYKNKWCNVLWLTCTVDTNKHDKQVKPLNLSNHRFSLKLNKWLNNEMDMESIRNGRVYLIKGIDITTNNNKQINSLIDKHCNNQLGLGNNIWLCFITWFVFRFRYPKVINVGNIKTFRTT